MSLTVRSGNDLSALFSGMNRNNSQSMGMGVSDMSGLLSEYNSIRNGSYAKLAKQYYSKDAGSSKINPLGDKISDTEGSVTNKTQALKSDTEIKQNKELISDVASMRKSISGITNDDTLFAKSDVKDAEGNTATDYNYSKLNEKLAGFVKNYNEVIENGSESDSQTVLRNVLNMTKTADNYKNQLATAGITIGDDNKLSFNQETLKNSLNSTDPKSGVDAVKNLFSKTSNFMRQMDTMATNVASQAASDVYSLGGYTSAGAYKQTLESIYNTVI